MKVVRPDSFIPYGPLGHPAAKFFFECEGPDLERVTEKFCEVTPGWPYVPPEPGKYSAERAELAEDGYFILPVVDGAVADEYMATLTVPTRYIPAPLGERGRRLEDFPHTIAGYYQHYEYEPFTNDSPNCDHDFGLESIQYVLKLEGSGEVLSLERAKAGALAVPAGDVYLTVRCTRCGDVHGLKQVSADGHRDLGIPRLA